MFEKTRGIRPISRRYRPRFLPYQILPLVHVVQLPLELRATGSRHTFRNDDRAISRPHNHSLMALSADARAEAKLCPS